MSAGKTTAPSRAGGYGAPVVFFIVACALVLMMFVGAAGVAASKPKSSTARLAAIHRLTPTQFAAIERVHLAALPLDEFRASNPPTQSKVDAATRAVLRACRKLSRKDPLLRSLRRACGHGARLLQTLTAAGGCEDVACMTDGLRSARATLRRGSRTGRAARRTINATNLTPRCKRALLGSPKAEKVIKTLDEALAKLQRGLAKRSVVDIAAARAALGRANKDANSLPTEKRSLQLLRSGCR